MSIKLEDFIAKLPKEEREAIEKRYQELMAEGSTLVELRKMNNLTQQQVAEEMGIEQCKIPRIEKCEDIRVLRLKSYIKALGGELTLIARFDNLNYVIKL